MFQFNIIRLLFLIFSELNNDFSKVENGVKVVDVDDDDVSYKPDDILIQLGGCGLFQMVMAIMIQTMKLVVCWVTGGNSFFAFVPRWRCLEYDMPIANQSLFLAAYTNGANYTASAMSLNGSLSKTSDEYWSQQCTIGEASCIKYEFEEGMDTLVPQVILIAR